MEKLYVYSRLGAGVDVLAKLGNRIARLRKKRGLTQKHLALESGVRSSRIEKIEAGECDLRVGTLVDIARALKVQVSFLLQELETDGSREEQAFACILRLSIGSQSTMEARLRKRGDNASIDLP